MDKIQIWAADGDCHKAKNHFSKAARATNCQMWDINPSVHRSRHCKDSVRVRQASVKTQEGGQGLITLRLAITGYYC